MHYQSPQTKRLLKFAKEELNVEPEFLWVKFPTYSVLRNPKNYKWFAVIMAISANKIGIKNHETIEVVNVRFIKGEAMEIANNVPGIYPAWHMNKKNWVTIALDDTLADNQLFSFIKQSLELSQK